jgi:hypothetical protein
MKETERGRVRRAVNALGLAVAEREPIAVAETISLAARLVSLAQMDSVRPKPVAI